MKWRWFNLASLVVGLGMLKGGAPWAPVVVGILGAAMVNYLRLKRAAAL